MSLKLCFLGKRKQIKSQSNFELSCKYYLCNIYQLQLLSLLLLLFSESFGSTAVNVN